jgi:AraC-like DNA-binding protein
MSSSGVCESVQMSQFLLAAASAAGVRASQLARDAQVPDWVLSANAAMTLPSYSLRLWERTEHALQDRDVALTVAARHQVGELDLYDYLFSTAATLREALQVSGRYLPLLTTNGQLRLESETGQEATYSYSYLEADGRGAELALEFSLAVFCARAQAGTGQPVLPTRVTFAHRAPRSHRAFTETFGTRRVDFGASATTFSIRASDLDLPMQAADPVLAGILRRYAGSLIPPSLASWQHLFRQQLSEVIEQGTPSLEAMARQMTVSPRTLQRRLAEHGTTWRAELDNARQQRAQNAGASSMTRLAHHLGYSGPRSVRRALHRWDRPQAGA